MASHRIALAVFKIGARCPIGRFAYESLTSIDILCQGLDKEGIKKNVLFGKTIEILLFKMGKEFIKCVKTGGRVRTIKPSPTTYMHICWKKNKSVPGEVKTIRRKTRGK